MSEYLFILLWLAAMAFFQRFVETEETIIVHGKKRVRSALWFAFLVIVPLIWITTNRGRNMGDTVSYIKAYNNMPTTFSDFPTYYSSIHKDRWFYIFEALVRILISNNYRVCFFIIAFFQAIVLMNIYRKYSSDYLMAIYIFVTVGDYISWMQNGIRQFVAVTICLLATTWMIEKKFMPSIITILIASRFHQSALLMIPIFLVCIGRPWNTRTLLLLVGVLFVIFFVSQFTSWLDTALEETQYGNVVTDWQSWNDDGTNPIRVLVYSIPMLLSLVGLRFIRESNDPVINFCTNMSIVAASLYLVSMVTSGIFIGRLPIYASLYSNGILLPWELKHMYTKKSSRYMVIFAIVGYLMLYIYQVYIRWGLI